jgi:hypothetical protein
MILRFEAWLINQQDRQDFVGDLARVLNKPDIERKFPGRKRDEHQNWADIVIRIAQPGHVDAFNEAWQEFLLEKQAALEASE